MKTNKIYFLAVNWEGVINTKPNDWKRMKYIQPHTAIEGHDIANFCDMFNYEQGWRIYAFTTKKQQESLISNILSKEEND